MERIVSHPEGVNPTATGDRRTRRYRAGSIYIFVLLSAVLVTVIGLSAVAVERVKMQEGVASDDWNEAGILAASAIEHALANLNTTPTWRTLYVNNTPITAMAAGRGTFSWKLVDETDGNLANDPSQKTRLYGIGRVGQAMRMYSVQIPGSFSVDAFRTAVASCKDVSSITTLTLIGGPLYTSGKFTSGTATNGNVEAGSLVNSFTISGTVTTPPPARTLPPASAYDVYYSLATDIPYNSLSLGQLSRKLLSATANPYGAANAQGIYKIDVPSTKTATITNCRLVATLVVTLGAGAKLNVTSPNLWQMPNNYPILIVKGDSTDTVTITGSLSNLMEAIAATNFNPPSTPYLGQSDSDMSDSYPNKLSGLIHIIGAVSTTIQGATIDHTIFSEGTIAFNNPGSTISVDSTLFSNPPMGYALPSLYIPIDGTWRWEVLP
jgi:hypothetical protein